jgi:hypothetical protein
LQLFYPDGSPFTSLTEQRRRADVAVERAEAERERADRLAEKLRSLGVDPQ